MKEYKEICAESAYIQPYGDVVAGSEHTCEIVGVTRFWNNSLADFDAAVSTDEEAFQDVSSYNYPDGLPAPHNYIMGHLERNADTNMIESAKSAYMLIAPPDTKQAEAWELDAVERVLAVNDMFEAAPGVDLRVQVVAESSLPAEFMRAITEDLVLVPIVFLMMSLFTAFVFTRRHKVYSRSFLGACAVFAVLLSIVSGFGTLFIIGVPFTSITQLLPFVVFGIGLDDAFIVMGSYSRTDQSKDPVERIEDTINDIGLSITLTTLTSATAFALGCMSTIPAVFWLCQYCVPTICFVFFYQLTFFVGCIVLDERRIAANKADICCCIQVQCKSGTDEDQGGPGEHVGKF